MKVNHFPYLSTQMKNTRFLIYPDKRYANIERKDRYSWTFLAESDQCLSYHISFARVVMFNTEIGLPYFHDKWWLVRAIHGGFLPTKKACPFRYKLFVNKNFAYCINVTSPSQALVDN